MKGPSRYKLWVLSVSRPEWLEVDLQSTRWNAGTGTRCGDLTLSLYIGTADCRPESGFMYSIRDHERPHHHRPSWEKILLLCLISIQ